MKLLRVTNLLYPNFYRLTVENINICFSTKPKTSDRFTCKYLIIIQIYNKDGLKEKYDCFTTDLSFALCHIAKGLEKNIEKMENYIGLGNGFEFLS